MMDKINPESNLLEQALGVLTKHGLDARVIASAPRLEPTSADALLEVGYAGQMAQYAVVIRRGLRPAMIGALVHQLERLGEKTLLVTDYVTSPVAEQLRTNRVAFVDLAGNTYLNTPSLLIWVKGEKAVAPAIAPQTGRAFQPTGLQVVFVLLCNPEAVNLPYRQLAPMVGVAHGTVGWVMADLQQLGYLQDIKGKRGTRHLFRKRELLTVWAENYARLLRPRTLLGRYYALSLQDWEDWNVQEYGTQWGGEPAAALLTGYLRPGAVTLYTDKFPGLLAARHKLVQHPTTGHEGVVELRKRFWHFPMPTPMRQDIVPPILVYADLLATGDSRCIETAKLVYEKHIAELLEQD